MVDKFSPFPISDPRDPPWVSPIPQALQMLYLPTPQSPWVPARAYALWTAKSGLHPNKGNKDPLPPPGP